METNVEELIKGAIEDDDHAAFDGVFDEDDLLGVPVLNGSLDDFGNSNDFSMSASGIGEDEFGVFECEPNNSMVSSASNHESFACSSPISPRHPDKLPSTFSNFEAIEESSSLTADDLCSEANAPVDDQYVIFSGNPSAPIENPLTPRRYRNEDSVRSISQLNAFEGHEVLQERIMKSPRRTVSATYTDANSAVNMTDDMVNMQQSGPPYFSPGRSYTNNSRFSSQPEHFDSTVAEDYHDSLLPSFAQQQIDQHDILHKQINQNQKQQRHEMSHSEVLHLQPAQMTDMSMEEPHQVQFHPIQQHSQMQNRGIHPQYMHNMQNLQQSQQQQQPISTFHVNPEVSVNSSPRGRSFRSNPQTMLSNSSHDGNFHCNSHTILSNSSHGVFRPNPQNMLSNSSHGGTFQAKSQPLTSNSYHGVPYMHNDPAMMNNSCHYPAASSSMMNPSFYHDSSQRRNSAQFNEALYGGSSSFSGMQVNVAIPPVRHAPEKYFIGVESQSESPSTIKNPSANINEVMEKLTERMRQSAMSRSMVKNISGRNLVSQNSSRGPIPGMMMTHHSARNLVKQGSERSVAADGTGRTLPMRRMSSNAKHQLSGRSLHRHDSHRSLNHNTAATVSLQIDGRNIGTF
jgi:hypothetical protein